MTRMIGSFTTRTAALLLLIAATAACAIAQPPHAPAPMDDGPIFVEGEPGATPVQVMADAAALETLRTGPQLRFYADGPGWVYSVSSMFVLTGSPRPWALNAAAQSMTLVGGTPDQQIELIDVETRDAASEAPWQTLDGTASWMNPTGNPEMYIELQFRINIRPEHTAGHYICPVTLDWGMPPSGGLPPTGGTINLELHLDVPEMLSVSTDVSSLIFPEDCGAAQGWIYSDTGHLTVTSNIDFQLSLSTGDDLTGPESYQLPTAMMFTSTTPVAPEWAAWAYLGGDDETLPSAPWSGDADLDSPWPGTVGAVHETFGQNTWDLDFAAWREGLADPEGDYSTTIVITVAVN